MPLTEGRKRRFERQIRFAPFGETGQEKLGEVAVVQVGCGGLGSTLAQCLVRAGVHRLTLIDNDYVDVTNLPRQFLYDEADAAQKVRKAAAAAEKLKAVDAKTEIVGIDATLSGENADDLLSGYDLVIDGTDNLRTRYVINDWCVKNNIVWIYGGISGATGMVMVVRPGDGPCFQCLYPRTNAAEKTSPPPIINTLPAHVATIQVTEAVKILIGSDAVVRELRIIDLWTGECQPVTIEQDPECPCCGKGEFPFLRPRE
jgi:adenylyltransferase/sulfurtransferase